MNASKTIDCDKKRFSQLLSALLIASGCSELLAQPSELKSPNSAIEIDYQIIQQIPHSTNFFTQGLAFFDGVLYESTGQYGASKLIRYDGDYRLPKIKRELKPKYFGEGVTAHQGTIYQLTWRAGTALAYEPKTLTNREGFNYGGEGWGLTSDGENLWLSNGTSQLQKLDTQGDVIDVQNITFNGSALNRLNELEWIEDKIFANRWFDNKIYIINPDSGVATHYLDLSEIAKQHLEISREKVLNGIAWQPGTSNIWITGKNWSYLYELQIELPDD